jgi:hypothetical protein
MKTNKTFKLTIWAMTEINKNNEKIFLHNFFDCPICKTLKAGTGIFGNIEEFFKKDLNSTVRKHIRCDNCGECFFPILSKNKFKNWEWEWIDY